jgi:hypothetical protein
MDFDGEFDVITEGQFIIQHEISPNALTGRPEISPNAFMSSAMPQPMSLHTLIKTFNKVSTEAAHLNLFFELIEELYGPFRQKIM